MPNSMKNRTRKELIEIISNLTDQVEALVSQQAKLESALAKAERDKAIGDRTLKIENDNLSIDLGRAASENAKLRQHRDMLIESMHAFRPNRLGPDIGERATR